MAEDEKRRNIAARVPASLDGMDRRISFALDGEGLK